MNMKIDVKFNFSFKLVLNIILKEKKDIQKKKRAKKRKKLMPFFFSRLFSLILIVYSPFYLAL